MFKFIKIKLNNIRLILTNSYYREFVRLLFKYGKIERNKQCEIKFLKYNILVADCLSFIFQFKEIFVKGYYQFKTNSDQPLIIDCGANIGISCIYFSKKYPSSKIYAFEADPNIFRLLKHNITTNGINKIQLIDKAVWINDDGINLKLEGSDSSSIYLEGEKTKVQSIRLKDYLAREDSIDFLKIDIEGAETEVIKDVKDELFKVKNIFIEYHSYKNQKQELNQILEVLSINNFRYFINTVYERENPFINRINLQNPEMDLQLNIFAYKEI